MGHLSSGLIVFSLLFSYHAHTQCLQGNCNYGKGVYVFTSGAKYSGEFKKGKMHGKGICYFTNGDIYQGEWFQNTRQGKGIFRRNNGAEYRGTFMHNKMHGEGTIHFSDGSSFTSRWELDKAVGEGTLIDENGVKQLGGWQNGQFIPSHKTQVISADQNHQAIDNQIDEIPESGSYTFADGSIYEGEIIGGQPAGLGTCFYSNGDKYVGEWLKNAPHGSGTLYYANKSSVKGRWINGKMQRNNLSGINYAPKSNPDEIDIYAVIVGVARYPDFEALKYTDDDAYRMYAFLKSPEGGAVPDEHIRILIDESAVFDNIMKGIDDVVAKADENDVVITYFAGHGLNGSFIPFDCNGYMNKLDYETVRSKLEDSRAKQKLCIIDACYSGSILASKAPMMESLNLFYNQLSNSKGGTAFMVSSKEEELSLESRGLRQGIFSHFLIEGLKGSADQNRNKIITVEELFDFVQKEVSSYSANAQNPILAGNFDRKMPVGLVR